MDFTINVRDTVTVEDVMRAVLTEAEVDHERGAVMVTPWGIYIGVDGALAFIVNLSTGDVEEVG